MTDAHVHLERGPYTREWVERFMNTAGQRGITRLHLLEHSHRFVEFQPLYEPIIQQAACSAACAAYQAQWPSARNNLSLEDYHSFVRGFDKSRYSVSVFFGLEIRYFESGENQVSRILDRYDFDFITGSVHWLDGWGFDHPKTQDEWKHKDVGLFIRELTVC